ncbi:hypothetical protein BJ170DRAFT_598467 [Xylariales sp. AK1849]|nr:hypothetical protein BJ170DRAFT_598467 [Xylariales sp. AK1849]
MSNTIVVTGVTGIQRVRGVTRNPSSEAAQALAARGVDIVKGDFDDKESLSTAFEGATAIFSNTEFFAHLFTPGDLPPGRNAKENAFDREVAQGVNIAEAAASPSVLKTLKRFVLSSLSDATKWSGGKYTTVYHYDSKAEMIRIIRARFPELAVRMSTVQIGNYVTNWKAVPSMAPRKQPDGSFVMFRPIAPDVKLPHVVTDRDTGSFVKALIDAPPGKHLLGVSQFTTGSEWMALWGDVMGVQVAYKKMSGDEF